jgi:hypothetical protein
MATMTHGGPYRKNTVNKALRTMACSALIESGLWSEDAI